MARLSLVEHQAVARASAPLYCFTRIPLTPQQCEFGDMCVARLLDLRDDLGEVIEQLAHAEISVGPSFFEISNAGAAAERAIYCIILQILERYTLTQAAKAARRAP
ncbi:hypothetical protein FNU76_23960 [Chitinimonas arctica]|uniref:Uncharacterized protein n=1 Tax=Chitinimonas arctica TaxID=2594795 RepID=A0A516S9P1_9NEIS|nr:hypothetical protein [Chitinimonas arctica]QDQ24856.1 hypothetical protein FNU76_00030 [Chitinimonas arctica]QDQ27679.1 hypothetical protein FNU76_15715 [Chitinimonas arctica]QDQ29160.1 hypothetical protein FNU76_23960 [Chitinimonas arctica]